METRNKIAVACFIGGALTMAVALALTPAYWWFGLIAGIAGGYISYKFREVLTAIPVAFRAARAWQPPQQYWAAVGWTALAFLTVSVWTVGLLTILTTTSSAAEQWGGVFYGGLVAMIVVGYFTLLQMAMMAKASDEYCACEVKMFRMMNYWTSPPLVFFWHLPRGIVWMLWRFPRVAVAFTWHLFKLIHSKERVLCAIDGTLGGAVSYIWLVPVSAAFAEQAMLVVCGGLLGSAFGVANYEIVSKRILHLPATETVRA